MKEMELQVYIADIKGAREEVRFRIGFRKRGARDCGEDRGRNKFERPHRDRCILRRGRKELSKTRRRGLRRRGTYEGDKPPVQTFTERRGEKQGSLSKRNYQETIRMRRLKQSLRVR